MLEGTVSIFCTLPSTACTTDIVESSSAPLSKETSTIPAGWISLPSASLKVMSKEATTSPPEAFSASLTKGSASSSVSSLTSATVPAGRMPAAAWSLTTYLPTACSAVNSGIEMKETETTFNPSVISTSCMCSVGLTSALKAGSSSVTANAVTFAPSSAAALTETFFPISSSTTRSNSPPASTILPSWSVTETVPSSDFTIV